MIPATRRIFYDNPNRLYKEDGFRHEIKYMLTQHEYFKLRDFFIGFMVCDNNAGEDGKYTVKSYYFDTLYFDDYIEKMNGIYDRQKYRIRTYDNSEYYRLEKKIKRGNVNKKMSGEICANDANLLITGYTDIRTGNEGTDIIISEMHRKGCKNSVYIEYSRQAFIMEELDIRITLDKDMGVLYGTYGLGEVMPAPVPVFYGGEAILEIKYKELIPKWLIKAVYQTAPSELSVSKYGESLKYILG